jgi:hypothetical protein
MLSLSKTPGIELFAIRVAAGILRGSVVELAEEVTVLTVTAVEGAGLTTEEKDGVTEDSAFNLVFMMLYTPPSQNSASRAEARRAVLASR